MVLADIESGKYITVVRFEGEPGLGNKLRQLGLAPGDRAQVIRQAPFGGPVLVDVAGRRIALGLRVAARIIVEVS